MKCGDCKDKKGAALDVGRPLELYDGRWCCPRCKKDIFPKKDSEFVVDAENRELFIRSEEAYYKWLTSAKEAKADRFKYLDKALNLCSEAAFELHPAALMRMGYYYENGYMDSSKSLKDRWNAAYRYYKAVCYNVNSNVRTSAEKDPSKEGQFGGALTEIKLECAVRLAAMLDNPPKEVIDRIKKVGFDGYSNINELKNDIYAKIKALGGEYKSEASKEIKVNETDNSDFAFSVWRSCFDEERAPLFAVFRLSASEAKDFLSGKGEFSVSEKISRDTYLKIAPADANGGIGPHGFETKKNLAAVTEYIGKIPSYGIYMMIFNSKGRHRYLKKHQISKIAECFGKDNDEYLRRLIRKKHYNSSVFYDDDIYIFKDKHASVKKAVEKFIEDVCEEN